MLSGLEPKGHHHHIVQCEKNDPRIIGKVQNYINTCTCKELTENYIHVATKAFFKLDHQIFSDDLSIVFFRSDLLYAWRHFSDVGGFASWIVAL